MVKLRTPWGSQREDSLAIKAIRAISLILCGLGRIPVSSAVRLTAGMTGCNAFNLREHYFLSFPCGRVGMRRVILRTAWGGFRMTFAIVGLFHKFHQDGFLSVEAVFGLVEDDGMGTIHHFIGNFPASFRGEAMHHNNIFPAEFQ